MVEELKGEIDKHRDKLEGASSIDELVSLLKRWLEKHNNDRD